MIDRQSGRDERSADLLATARQLASVVGNFEPLALARQLDARIEALSSPLMLGVLSELGRECDEVEINASTLWRLRPTAREAILAHLRSDDALRKTAVRAAPLVTDELGEVLILSANGELERAAAAIADSPSGLSTLENALKFLGENAQLGNVRSQIQRDETEQAFRFLLPGELIGRDGELAALSDFIETRDSTGFPSDYFLLTGDGGAGKSALLAEFARRELAKGDDARPVIWLDLDRPMLAATDPVQLMQEFARQLTLYWPDQRENLASFRREVEQMLPAEGLFESSESQLSRAFGLWNNWLSQKLPVTKPVILILDTFEEAILHGDWNADRIERWIDGLTTEARIPGLKPVFSGRAFDPAWRARIATRVHGQVELKGLQPAAACQLLAAFLSLRDIAADAFDLKALTERYGGHPLLLKILAQYLAEEGPGAQKELLAGAADTGLDHQFAQQFLYTRILSRVRTQNPKLVKLAFPGLALRRITADLIVAVLAQPCEIEPIDTPAATSLLNELARQIWLVEPGHDPDVVRHRRDLRRNLLRSVPPDQKEIVRQIHERAALYYADGRDKALDHRSQRVEALYHGLMAGRPVEGLAEPEAAQAFLDALGEDAESLPIEALARIKFDAGRLLNLAEAGSLDAESIQEIDADRARDNQKAGYRPNDNRTRREGLATDIDVADEFFDGHFDTIVNMCREAFEWDFIEAPRRKRASRETFITSASWRTAIAAITTGAEEFVGRELHQFIDEHRLLTQMLQPFGSGSRGVPNYGQVLTAICELLNLKVPRQNIPRFHNRERYRDVDTIAGLRILQTYPADPDAGPAYVSLGLFRSLQTTTLDLLTTYMPKGSDQARAFEDWLDDMERGGRPPLHKVAALDRRNFILPASNFPSILAEHCLLSEFYSVLERCGGKVPLARLIEISDEIGSSAHVWPAELSGAAFAEGLEHDRKRWTASLVEMADRAGCLGRLAARMAPYALPAADAEAAIDALSRRLAQIEPPPL